MNLFKLHSAENFERSKEIFGKLITKSSRKYVALQTEVNIILVASDPKKANVKNLTKMLAKMAKIESTLAQASKAYELIFKEEYDFSQALNKAVRKTYSKSTRRAIDRRVDSEMAPDGSFDTRGEDFNFDNFEVSSNIDETAPPEVQEMFRKIKKWGEKKTKGTHTKMRMGVIDVTNPDHTMGLKPSDYPNIAEFIKAVNSAKNKKRDMDEGKVTAEEVIADAVIHKAEKDSQSTQEDKKLN
jgi:hypothetical protein